MSNTIPANSSIAHGVSDDNADTFKALDAAREKGTLANSREQADPNVQAPVLKLSFQEKGADELEKLTKKELLTYMQEWHEHKDIIAEEMVRHAAVMAQQAAIHGIPMRPRGEVIPQLLEANPEHPGRQVPYPILDEDGEPRMTKGNKRQGPSPITRTDN